MSATSPPEDIVFLAECGAFREGQPIGQGVFARRNMAEGEPVTWFIDGSYMRLKNWPGYCHRCGLPSECGQVFARIWCYRHRPRVLNR